MANLEGVCTGHKLPS